MGSLEVSRRIGGRDSHPWPAGRFGSEVKRSDAGRRRKRQVCCARGPTAAKRSGVQPRSEIVWIVSVVDEGGAGSHTGRAATDLAWKIQKLCSETISVLIILHEIDELNFVRARICFVCSVYNCIPVTELLRLSNKSPSEGLAGCVSLMRGGPVILWELRNASTVQHSHGRCCGHGSCSLRQR